VRSLDIIQGKFTVQPIENGADDSLTTVTLLGKSVVVKSQMVSLYFANPNLLDMIAEGVVTLAFGDSCRHRALRRFSVSREHKILPGEEGNVGYSLVMRLQPLGKTSNSNTRTTPTSPKQKPGPIPGLLVAIGLAMLGVVFFLRRRFQRGVRNRGESTSTVALSRTATCPKAVLFAYK